MASLQKLFVLRYVKRGTRRTAYIRRVDQPDGWIRVRMPTAEKMLRNGTAVEETR